MAHKPSICKSYGWGLGEANSCAILGSMLKMHGKSLDDESLLILMAEVERILNSRPLTVETINEPSSFQPLLPVNILTMKSKIIMPPPGKSLRPVCIVQNVGGECST